MNNLCEIGLNEFPVSGLLPRKETGALQFVNKHPSYDGRGTIIAIFDSGVDPSAPGLQVTTENEVKIIDRIDASGAGDIDMSTVITAELGSEVTGLSGRKLKIPDSWNNPDKTYHLGVLHVYQLYPSKLEDRVAKEIKEKQWDPVHRICMSKAQKRTQSVAKTNNCSNKSPPQTASCDSPNNDVSSSRISVEDEESTTQDGKQDSDDKQSLSVNERLAKENALAELSLLKTLEKKYNDLGPTYDVLVYHDDNSWRACLDRSECGDLTEALNLGEYRITHEYGSLNESDQYTVTVNVHNDGNLLEIVGMCSSHGTHVASIASANFPEDADRNGVAPGAKIVSITIGDNRLSAMETGTALVRAMNRVMKNPHYKVDVINMSYGEHGHYSDAGRIGDLAHEVVNKYGVMWLASAGNHGPALYTVGVPPDFFSDSVIGIGAYVSPDMMTAEYSMTEKLTGRPYTWSSRGPCTDGGRGVSLCAPGGAITSVPKFTLRCNQLMNGTSMAAPHATGCVALLLSALKARNIAYTPYSVRRALQNSATPLVTDVFAQGHGLINVEKSLEYHKENENAPENKVRFSLQCGMEKGKGIHVRNWTAEKSLEIPVNVETMLFVDEDADPKDKLSVNFNLVLSCQDSWVRFPPCFQISYTSRVFKVILDPSGLERGSAYFSCIKAFDSEGPERGPLFDIPITMIVPHLNLVNNYSLTRDSTLLKSGSIHRHFVYVPLGATMASITVRTFDSQHNQRITLHAVQIVPQSRVSTIELYKTLNLGPNEKSKNFLSVQGGLVLEVCLARWWSCLTEAHIGMEVEFHGILPQQEIVCLGTGDGFHRVDVRSGLRPQEIQPHAMLKHHSQVLTPSDSVIQVLSGSDRDTLPEDRIIYQLVLTYTFNILGKSPVEITPKCSLLNHVLYESPFESQLWMIFDSNKQYLASGDAFFKKYVCKLDRGTYTIKLHVRHDKISLLENLKDIPIEIMTKLSQEVKVDVYYNYCAAASGGKKASSSTIGLDVVQPIFITPPSLTEKALKSLPLSTGDCLTGEISFWKSENFRKLNWYPLRVFITDLASKKKSTPASTNNSEEKKETKTPSEYEEALRDLKTSWIAKLDKDNGEKVLKEVMDAHPDHLPALLARLQSLDSAHQEVASVARQIIDAIDVDALLAYYGTKSDSRHDAAKVKTQMDRQKLILLEALVRQGNSVYHSSKANEGGPGFDPKTLPEDVISSLDNTASEILKFAEPADPKVVNFFVNYYCAKDCKALAARLVSKQYEDKPSKELYQQLTDFYSDLGWTHAVSYMNRTKDSRFPKDYRRF